jgi:hypothetical protein
MQVPADLVKRMGESVKTLDSGPVFRALQIAWALNISEQTVSAWARQGRIPPGELVMGVRWWSIEELQTIATKGVQPVGFYLPPSPAEVKRLAEAMSAKKKAKSAAKKGGAR